MYERYVLRKKLATKTHQEKGFIPNILFDSWPDKIPVDNDIHNMELNCLFESRSPHLSNEPTEPFFNNRKYFSILSEFSPAVSAMRRWKVGPIWLDIYLFIMVIVPGCCRLFSNSLGGNWKKEEKKKKKTVYFGGV
jgi:hypothetical protein